MRLSPPQRGAPAVTPLESVSKRLLRRQPTFQQPWPPQVIVVVVSSAAPNRPRTALDLPCRPKETQLQIDNVLCSGQPRSHMAGLHENLWAVIRGIEAKGGPPMGVQAQLTGRILVVCTGNVCRSPFIERVLRLKLAGLDIVVESAGTGALVGEPIDPCAAAQIRAHGADPGGYAARQITAGLIEEADLVLTATRRHRGEVAVISPRALRYAFAWNDFAELVRAMRAEELDGLSQEGGLRQVVAAVAARRGSVPPRSAQEVDIVDPYRQGRAVFEQMGEQVMAALPDVVRALRR